MTDNGARAVCPTHEVGYPRGEACPYCERGEVVRAPFYSQHPGYEMRVSLADGPPKTPAGRMEVMRSLLWPHLDEPHLDEDGELTGPPLMRREYLGELMAGAVESSVNARAAESRAAGVSEAHCPKCGEPMSPMRNGYACNRDQGCMLLGFPPETVWRRWEDTEKEAGWYWLHEEGASTELMWVDDSALKSPWGHVWVLGPLTVPHVPEAKG